ncbi:hypothetical protein GCM10010274_06550 [Streptomyces lavendofoliae]|uniref:Uncharacterized protein n=1 Tax=Streptomyces lavendofoliae TaxID=67314 RepID=A0A918M2J6_9ACTN|nr:hypothetical protein GCM10010274_06550 [Streptomyces lavendofoliae]
MEEPGSGKKKSGPVWAHRAVSCQESSSLEAVLLIGMPHTLPRRDKRRVNERSTASGCRGVPVRSVSMGFHGVIGKGFGPDGVSPRRHLSGPGCHRAVAPPVRGGTGGAPDPTGRQGRSSGALVMTAKRAP